MIANVILLQILNGNKPLIDIETGSCSIEGYKKWLLLDSINFSLGKVEENSDLEGVVTGGSTQSIVVTRPLDPSSVYLMHLAAQEGSNGEKLEDRTAKITFLENKAFGPKDNRLEKLYPTVQFLLGTVRILDWSIEAGTSDAGSEQFSLTFTQFSMVYMGLPVGTKSIQRHGPKSWDGTKRDDWSDGDRNWFARS